LLVSSTPPGGTLVASIPTMILTVLLVAVAAALSRRGAGAVKEDLPPRVPGRASSWAQDRGGVR